MKRTSISKIRSYDSLPDLVTPEEARQFLRLSRNKIYLEIQEGTIPSRRFGRVIRIPKTALLNSK